jgi:hypothetical protein
MNAPRRDLPFLTGRYTVSPGLSKLGNERAFERDHQLPHYLATKARLLTLHPASYYQTHLFPPPLEQAVCQLIRTRFQLEYPAELLPDPSAGLDAYARQLQEDLVVIRRDGDRDWNAAIHLCFPNGWSAEEKIGKSFFDTHTPVAGIEPINRRAADFVDMMIAAESGLQRFVWGIRTDGFLDHHPESPSLPWNPVCPLLFVRVERQVILGLPTQQAALFLIRTYLHDAATLTSTERQTLADALDGMSEASSRYKGIHAHRQQMSAFLRGQ